jgi:hypothetical protein
VPCVQIGGAPHGAVSGREGYNMSLFDFIRVFFGPVFAILAALAVYEWIDETIIKWRKNK